MKKHVHVENPRQSDNRTSEAKILCVSSGKGGVGKTLSVVYLSVFAAKLGKKVLIIDGDFGMSNVDIVLGLHARYNIRDVFDGRASLHDVLLSGPNGIKVIPSGSGLTNLAQLTFVQRQILLEDLKFLEEEFDLIIIDTGAGIGSNVTYLNQLANRSLVITSPEPHAMTDAYALIKAMKETNTTGELDLIVNMTQNEQEGSKVGTRIASVAREFLNVDVNYLGAVPADSSLTKFILRRDVLCEDSLRTHAAQAWGRLARNMLSGLESEKGTTAKRFLTSYIQLKSPSQPFKTV
ncbi:MAG: AAA family ATPase [Deltaproteobacteria bacterium]|nr:AAA family ATPase [Deltaproteobacteria bacterium]